MIISNFLNLFLFPFSGVHKFTKLLYVELKSVIPKNLHLNAERGR